MREWCVAPIAEKKTKRFAPARSAARTSRSVATAFSSSIEACGWSRIAAARWTTVSHAAQGVAERGRVGQVAERDLDAHALVAEPARVAHEAAHGRAARRSAAAAARSRPSPWRP